MKSPVVPNLDLYKTNFLQTKSPTMNITSSILKKTHQSTKSLLTTSKHRESAVNLNDLESGSLSSHRKKGMPSPALQKPKYANNSKGLASTKSMGNLSLVNKTPAQIKKEILDKEKESVINAKRVAYYKKYGIVKKLEQTVEQNKTIAIFSQG